MDIQQQLDDIKTTLEQIMGWSTFDFVLMGMLPIIVLFLWRVITEERERIISEISNRTSHGYWQKQQIEQLRRERLEEFMSILMEETDKFTLAKDQASKGEKVAKLEKPNKRPYLICYLYFPDLLNEYINYYTAQNEFLINLSNLISKKYNKSQVEELFEELVIKWGNFTDYVFKNSEGLTYSFESENQASQAK